jgi:hypothetical protein
MRNTGIGIKQFFSAIPRFVLASTVLFPVAGLVLGYVAGPVVDPANIRSLLSGLAGAQAAVLAIVFSVTVIGIQLTGTRYSPRMVSIFTEAPIFLYSFSLFVLSIGLDFWLLYNVPETGSQLHTAGVFAASSLSLAVAITLFVFVKSAIQQSTPEGAIETFVSGITTEKYVSQSQKLAQDGSENVHPMHPLYNLIMNALSQGEHATAEKAIQEYGDLVQNTLEELEEQDRFSNLDRKVVKELFDPVLTEHLRDIALHAEEQDETQLTSDAIEIQYELGKAGLVLSTNTISRQAQFGISYVIRDSPVEAGELIANNNAWKQLGNLLVDASEHPQSKIVWNISSSIEQNVQRQLWKVSDIHWYRHSMTDLYRSMETAHEALLDHYGEEVADVDMEWQYEHVPDGISNRDEISAVFNWKEALLDTTSQFLSYVQQEGQYPVTEGNFKDNWKNICIEASKSPAEDYAITLCQTLIEIAVIHRSRLGETGIPWSSTIGRVKYKGDPEIVDKAFERILDYDYVEEEPGPVSVGEMEEHRQRYYQNQLKVQEFQPLNNRPGFREEIEEIQKEADKRWEQLKD